MGKRERGKRAGTSNPLDHVEIIMAVGRTFARGRRRIVETLVAIRRRSVRFFWKHCRAGLPWFWPAQPLGQHVMVEARRIVRSHYGRDNHPVLRKVAQVLVTVMWLPTVLLNLRDVRDWFGPWEAVLARVPGALWAAIRHNILPSEYYQYQLWQPDRRKNIDNYLYVNETPRLFKVLNRGAQVDPILDKLAFYELCKTHRIPTPEVFAIFTPTSKLMDFRPPQHDLFIKARTGAGGEGAERFQWDGALFQCNRGCQLRPEDFAGYLANRARTENLTLLVQPALANHPAVCSESGDALATARLVTGRSLWGEVMPIFCYVLWGLPGKITAHSNCVTLVNVANGQFMSAPPQNSPGMSIYKYLDMGDARMPHWDRALSYVKAAHKACFNFVFIGWDVAFTPEGPMILEGNTNWSPTTYQTLRGEPLGLTNFAGILATQLCSKKEPPTMSDTC